MLEEGCGVLVNAHDIKGITEALKLVCENDLLKVSMGELAFSRAQEYYSLKAIFEQYSILWHKLSDLEK